MDFHSNADAGDDRAPRRRRSGGRRQRPEDRIENDPNVREWGLFPEVRHPKMGKVRVDGMPMKAVPNARPHRIRRSTLGQHNAQVFGDVLGMDESTVADPDGERGNLTCLTQYRRFP